MNIESQVTSLEIAKQLKEAGVEVHTEFAWFIEAPNPQVIHYSDIKDGKILAPTATELLELLREKEITIEIRKYEDEEHRYYVNKYLRERDDLPHNTLTVADDKLADALAKLLLELVNQDILDVEEINNKD